MAERWNYDQFQEKIAEKEKLILVDFYSDSCVPCKVMSPVLAELEEAYASDLVVGKVNIAYEQDLVSKYGVSSVPTLIFLKEQKEVERLTGVQKKDTLEEIIEKNK